MVKTMATFSLLLVVFSVAGVILYNTSEYFRGQLMFAFEASSITSIRESSRQDPRRFFRLCGAGQKMIRPGSLGLDGMGGSSTVPTLATAD